MIYSIYVAGVIFVFVFGMIALFHSYWYNGYTKLKDFKVLLGFSMPRLFLMSLLSWFLYFIVGFYFVYDAIFDSQGE